MPRTTLTAAAAIATLAACGTPAAAADPLQQIGSAINTLQDSNRALGAGLHGLAAGTTDELTRLHHLIPALAALASADLPLTDNRRFGIGLGLAFNPQNNAPAGAVRLGWRQGPMTLSLGAAIPPTGAPIIALGISASW